MLVLYGVILGLALIIKCCLRPSLTENGTKMYCRVVAGLLGFCYKNRTDVDWITAVDSMSNLKNNLEHKPTIRYVMSNAPMKCLTLGRL